ncbi:MAG TPA: carboxylesterase family protein [Caulobacteraceae bacterium]|jgi:para-nitrobenzyl esterase
MIRQLALAFVALAAATSAIADPVPVRLDTGLVSGAGLPDGVLAFKGVPYAAPPVGPLRWRPPQPAPRWDGMRAATAFGAVCPQAESRALPAGTAQSEDCLTLNVWAPPAAKGAPVMVWLHGGGDDTGTASQPQFDGDVFAKDGVVFVSVDYRLGALGWFAHPALTKEAGPGAPLANYGLMDEIAALKWVKRNIAAFGGDPARVTVAGESSGGQAVLFLLATPAARGLFAQAVVESGAGWGGFDDLAKAEAHGAALAAKAGAPADATAEQLRALPVSALVAAGGGLGVTVDGRLVAATPSQAFDAAREAKVPLLIGSNSGEDSLLEGSDPANMLKDFAPDQLTALRTAYGAEAPDDATLGRDIFRDEWMGAPARWFAARHSRAAPAWLYQFDYNPTVLRPRRTRASHGMEMLFVFAAMARAPLPLIAVGGDAAEMALVHGCWVAFVKTGKPGCPGGVTWPAYDPATDQTMVFGPDGAAAQAHFRKGPYDLLGAARDATQPR